MERRSEQMNITTFMLPAGYHKDSWRLPGSRAEELGYLDFVLELTLMAEAAKLDAVFFGDIVTADTILRNDVKMNGLYEPVTVLAALAARTTKIGLIGTISTTFSEPYNTARQILGIDHMSGGRAGWNIVTSSRGNSNFGLEEMPDPADRYRRATEYLDVVTKLWDSWDADAVVTDRESGVWADTEKLHRIDHRGEFFTVQGPLNMRPSLQGRPILVQAGSSGPGIDLGSSFADCIYTAQPDKRLAQEYYANYKRIVTEKGRNPAQVKILPGLVPIMGDTVAEAQELADHLAAQVNMEFGVRQLEASHRIDLTGVDLDDRVPVERFPAKLATSRSEIFRRRAFDDGLTLRELIIEDARGTGHGFFIGTPGQAAEYMIDWFDDRACDGFNVNAPFMPGGMQMMCERLIPELQERGYFREDYSGDTLRDHLGLDDPAPVIARS
ncbi:NtaA/DmoA family FMN-dependent monooxygenase [Leucobacter rhizosphaerae]|uniref:NtaA/DmoA family FMN-dependent monooxygenase n=1 Tax=Leucobacter rhizosphaerae TaxID=2932245 RepID=A0ABY4FS09_9MICO|nr:NtaA/DmoA family FMN-dependent monooxygenase [Leucobacter rhizosphaerae]UOQ59076.1 NtaA/DmoA family FMN-dependent monooxygenase [Leucobacter rhizosphaerae]